MTLINQVVIGNTLLPDVGYIGSQADELPAACGSQLTLVANYPI